LIEIFEEIASTSDKLLQRLAKGEALAEGKWVVADRQTAGRGRQGRSWFDGAGNFMGSTYVNKLPGDPPLSSLALAAGLAVVAAVTRYIDPPRKAELKWPNDLMVDGAKLSGILLEGAREGVVVGIGVNLKVAPKLLERTTVALSRIGSAPDRDTFAVELADAFDREVELWRKHGLAALIARWLAAAHPIGTPLSAGEAGQDLIEGTFAGLTPDGALQLRLADGSTRAIHAGEVNLS
jgi:BirA family transcriptional regulator, biotin operon repressor / biotin---[acetyl-CoA-carboxylase] ligase